MGRGRSGRRGVGFGGDRESVLEASDLACIHGPEEL